MNAPAGLMLAAILSTVSLAGCTSAQTTGSTAAMATTGTRVAVIYIKEVYDKDDAMQVPYTYRRALPATIAAAQDKLAADPNLRAALVAKNVQLRNVVGIDTALNGGKVVYVR